MTVPPTFLEPGWSPAATGGEALWPFGGGEGGWTGRHPRAAPAALSAAAALREGGAARPAGGALASAVAAIVAIAAQRAFAAGELGQLRALVERALEVGEPAAEEAEEAGLPPIADADPAEEARRLGALLQRQRG